MKITETDECWALLWPDDVPCFDWDLERHPMTFSTREKARTYARTYTRYLRPRPVKVRVTVTEL